MTKTKRLQVYNKYGGRCAYCGKKIEYKDMQVDHIVPQRSYIDKKVADQIENLNPSCRKCNHYKRARSIERYRELILKLHTKIRDIYLCEVAENYGVIKIEPWDGQFYFERFASPPVQAERGGGET